MNEKRFEFYSDDYLIGVLDNVTGKTLNHFATIDLLNEQQATIEALKEENEKLRRKLEYCEHEHFLDSLGSSNKWFGMGGF